MILHPRQSIGLEISRAEGDMDRARCGCRFVCRHHEKRVEAAGRLMELRALARQLDVALVKPIVVEVRS